MGLKMHGTPMEETTHQPVVLRLHQPKFVYIASPYTHFPGGHHAAMVAACKAVVWCLEREIPAFSPIAHSHAVALYGGLDPLDHDIWLPADEPMMHAAAGLAVWMLEGWTKSKGVLHEISVFEKAGKPIRHMVAHDPDTHGGQFRLKKMLGLA